MVDLTNEEKQKYKNIILNLKNAVKDYINFQNDVMFHKSFISNQIFTDTTLKMVFDGNGNHLKTEWDIK